MAERDYREEMDALREDIRTLSKDVKRLSGSARGEISDRAQDYWQSAHGYYDEIGERTRTS